MLWISLCFSIFTFLSLSLFFQEIRVLKGLWVNQACRVFQVIKVPLGTLEMLGNKDFLGPKVNNLTQSYSYMFFFIYCMILK